MIAPRTLAQLLITCSLLIADVVTVVADRQDIDALVESIGANVIEKEHVVGISIGVAQHGSILCEKGFGLANVELNVSATAATVYRIGSITKEFTAAAILLLVDDGEVKLDDPLSRFLPEYPQPGSKVTIRQLLQHTSGIQDFTSLPAYRKQRPLDVSPDEVLRRFQDLPLGFRPGEQHQYCNSGYFLLGLVIEQASGMSYRDFLAKRLFGPQGMHKTYCDSQTRIIAGRASGYTRWGGVLRNAPPISLKQTVGAGNLASTVGDLLIWQHAIFNADVVSRDSSALMVTKGKLNGGASFHYGLGVFIRQMNGHKVLRHGGGISGFHSDVTHYPQSGYTIAVLANSEHANAPRISDRIARQLLTKNEPN